jgi:conjugal transfer pilus assembly protein TraA
MGTSKMTRTEYLSPAFGMCIVAMAAVIFYNSPAFAGTGGTEFDALLELGQDWLQGSLGKVLALVGLGFGLAAAAMGGGWKLIGGGFGVSAASYYGPDIIESINSYSIQAANTIHSISNAPALLMMKTAYGTFGL